MNRRIFIIGLTLSFFILVLAGYLWRIQVSGTYRLSEGVVKQRILQISVEKERGNFLDRNGIPFTGGTYKTQLVFFPAMLKDYNNEINHIALWTGISKEALMKQLQNNPTYLKYPMEHIALEDQKKVMNGEYPGVAVMDVSVRYSQDSLARHVIGYMNEASETGGDWLEKSLDNILKTSRSKVIYGMMDAKQHIIPGIGYKIGESEGQAPLNVVLTLDYHIQKIVEEELDKKKYKGSVVVVEAETGNILAMASRPNFDQNNFNKSIQAGDSFINRSIIPVPPGSVFKTIVLAAALEDDAFDENQTFTCTGGIQLGSNFIACHESRGGLGELNMEQAFAYSCNDTFIRIAQDIGGDRIIQMAERFGFTKPVDIDLPGETPSSLPQKNVYAGNGIGNLAIGQGDVALSPLHAADMMTTIINGGVRKHLKLIEGYQDASGSWRQYFDNEEIGRVIPQDIAEKIKHDLDAVVMYGTGTSAGSESFGQSGGKTGTPQIQTRTGIADNGWFVGYFPRDNPQYVMAVFLENVKSGGGDCGPLFSSIAEKIHEYTMDFIKQSDENIKK